MVLLAYTDGSCNPNPGNGSHGYIIVQNNKEIARWKSKIISNTTNNIQEMSAVIKVLEDYPNVDTVISDSNYVVKGITIWSKSWIQKDFKIKGVERPNSDLWRKLIKLNDLGNYNYKHIKAHTKGTDSDSFWNNEIDQFIQNAAKLKISAT